jgi:hypothetical protein
MYGVQFSKLRLNDLLALQFDDNEALNTRYLP